MEKQELLQLAYIKVAKAAEMLQMAGARKVSRRRRRP
jgi:hypothetical protein